MVSSQLAPARFGKFSRIAHTAISVAGHQQVLRAESFRQRDYSGVGVEYIIPHFVVLACLRLSSTATAMELAETSPSKGLLKEHVQVRYTGDWSSDSKLSCVVGGYWEDPFLSLFNKVDPVPRRTSLICRGYYVRFRVCDFFLRNILRAAEEPIQILSLGCGMDTTFFRVLPQFESKILRFFELDFPSVIEAKKEIIAENEILKVMQHEKLTLLGADLRDTSSLKNTLRNANFDFEKTTIFYSECVVNYLMPTESKEILTWIVNNVPKSVWLAYEQCFSNDSFGRIMMKHFEKNGCPLLSLPSSPDMETQKEQLKKVGFKTRHIFNVWDAFVHLSKMEESPFPKTSGKIQFDEYEALMATCLHYSVRIATSGDVGSILKFINDTETAISQSHPPLQNPSIVLSDENSNELMSCTLKQKLTNHTSVVCSSKELMVVGGVKENSHRSTALEKILYQFSTENSNSDDIFKNECIREDKQVFERLHSAAVFHLQTSSFYVFGGRKSPRIQCDNAIVQVSCCKTSYVIKVLTFPDVTSPCSRWRHAMAIVSQNLFLFGGKNEKEVFGDCWIFKFLEGRWTQLVLSSAPSVRHSHSMCSDSVLNYVYCIGGMSSNETQLCEDAVWRYEQSDATSPGVWTNISELNAYGQRIGHSVAFHDNVLFIVGGYGANSSHNLDHFVTLMNMETKAVKVCNLALGPEKVFLPFGFSLAAIVDTTMKETKIMIYGGGGNCFSFGTHYNDAALVINLDNNRLMFFDC
ncbi:unnamed protein product [Allacma fusca]|uniref:Uncharacterized protein n=1 Tax=Allacma fusca TaxID=39272 RepID=A0A8J2LD92_9HEXA|nr:unnamed protein product [Allacma fusca]